MDPFNNAWFEPSEFPHPDFLHELETLETLQSNGYSLHHTTEAATTANTTSNNTSTSPSTPSNTVIGVVHSRRTRKRRWPTSEGYESEVLIRTRKTRKLRSPEETAKVRKKGACFLCKLKKKVASSVFCLPASFSIMPTNFTSTVPRWR